MSTFVAHCKCNLKVCQCGCDKIRMECDPEYFNRKKSSICGTNIKSEDGNLPEKENKQEENITKIASTGRSVLHGDQLMCHEIDPKTLHDYLNRLKIKTDTECDIKKRKCLTRKYYQFGLLAQIDSLTTDNDLQRLFKNDFRTIVIQSGFIPQEQMERIIIRLNSSIAVFNAENLFSIPIGIAIEIRGDVTRVGRIRNDESIKLNKGSLTVLTANEEYRNSSMSEVLYIWNLWRYLDLLKVGDIIYMNSRKIEGKVVKNIKKYITICIIKGGTVKSFADVEIPYYNECYQPNDFDIEDLSFAVKNNADFIILPGIRSYNYLRSFQYYFHKKFCREFKIIGKFDFNFLYNKTCEVYGLVQECVGIWMDNVIKKVGDTFIVNHMALQTIKIAQELNKPLIATMPIKSRKDFHKLENHPILNEFDALLVQKSSITGTFPIIAKNVSPLQKDLIKGQIKVAPEPLHPVSSRITNQEALINCVNSIINTTYCSGIVINSTPDNSAILKLSNRKIYCPVIAIIEQIDCGKLLNLRRNLKPVIFKSYVENATHMIEEKAIHLGLEYGKEMNIFNIGDFIMTFFEFALGSTLCSKLHGFYLPIEKVYIHQQKMVDEGKSKFFNVTKM